MTDLTSDAKEMREAFEHDHDRNETANLYQAPDGLFFELHRELPDGTVVTDAGLWLSPMPGSGCHLKNSLSARGMCDGDQKAPDQAARSEQAGPGFLQRQVSGVDLGGRPLSRWISGCLRAEAHGHVLARCRAKDNRRCTG